MKMSWGIKIAIVYASFVGMIVFLVFRTAHENIDLVTQDYYQQELEFQNRIDQTTAMHQLGEEPAITITTEGVEIVFPDSVVRQGVAGRAVFYRASDASKDFIVELQVDEAGAQLVDHSRFLSGMYQLRLIWMSDGHPYYFEKQLYIP
jgi:hypothetical protein